MKKFLLLLMAWLLLAPSTIYAQATSTLAKDKEVVIFNSERATVADADIMYNTTEGGVFTAWDPSKMDNNGYFTESVKSIQYNGERDNSGNTKTIFYINDITDNFGYLQLRSANNQGYNWRMLMFNINGTFRIQAYYGKIKKIVLYVDQSQAPNATQLKVTGSETDEYGYVMTLPFTEKPYDVNDPSMTVCSTSCKTFTINPSTAQDYIDIQNNAKYGFPLKIFKLTVTYDELNAVANAPTFTVTPGFGTKRVDGEFGAITYEMPFIDNSANLAYYDALEDLDVYYTFNETLGDKALRKEFTEPTTEDFITTITSSNNATNKWVKIDAGTGLNFAGKIPTDADLDNAEPIKIYGLTYNKLSRTFSFPEIRFVQFVRLPALVPDIEKMEDKTINPTAENFYVCSQGHLHYTGYNPRVIFKLPDDLDLSDEAKAKIKIQYNTSYDALPESATENAYTTTILVKNGEEDDIPGNGETSRINFRSYVVNKNGTQNIKYYLGNAGGATVTLQLKSDNSNFDGKITQPSIFATENVVNLQGGGYGFVDNSIIAYIHSNYDWDDDDTTPSSFEYQIVPKTGSAWPQAPSSNEADWKPVSHAPIPGGHTYTVPITETSTLFVRETRTRYETSDYASCNFEKINAYTLPNIQLETLNTATIDGTVVSINVGTLWIRGVYNSTNAASNGKTQQIMFVSDDFGNALRIVGDFAPGEPNFEKWRESREKNVKCAINKAVGVLRGQGTGTPELLLTSSTTNYLSFLGQPQVYNTSTNHEPPTLKETPTVNKTDYSKLMLFSNMTWDGDESFIDENGNKTKIFHRIGSDKRFNVINAMLDKGITYRIQGYVGYSAEDGVVILPLAVVPGPRLLAPNPINPEAAPGQYIDMNVISESLAITINQEDVNFNSELPEGITEEDIPTIKLQYLFDNPNYPTNWEDKAAVKEWMDKLDWDKVENGPNRPGVIENVTTGYVQTIATNGTINVTFDNISFNGETGTTSRTLAVRLINGDLASGVVTVRFNKIDAIPVMSISNFKNHFTTDKEIAKLPLLDKPIDDATHRFFQYKGYARVRAVTPHYLYIRTTGGNGEPIPYEDNAELSSHSILLYNANGWNQNVAGILSTNNAPLTSEGQEIIDQRPLQAGDVISNFAIIPTRSQYGNLIGNATGFIRTFRRFTDLLPGSNDPLVMNAMDDDSIRAFQEGDRMLRFTIKNVNVKKVYNNFFSDEEMPGPDDEPMEDGNELYNDFYYFLDMPGHPILMNGGIFDKINGWDIVQDDNTPFTITGVAMLYDGTKGLDADGKLMTNDEGFVVDENGELVDGRYMIALESYEVHSNLPTPDAPIIRLSGSGVDNTNNTFATTATVVLRSSEAEAEDNKDIYYTLDGSDPRTSETAKKYVRGNTTITINANTVVKAYVLAKGAPNSEVAEAIFTRTSVESRYIVSFVLNARANTPYHFSGNVRVVAKGGDYFFVRGTQGHYLPINIEDNCIDTAKIHVGDYLNDMVIKPHILSDGTLRGAHVEEEYAGLFVYGSAEMPAELSEPIVIDEPDEVSTITPLNARRFVRINNVSLEGFKIETEDPDIAVQDADKWILHTDQGEGEQIEVNHTVLKPQFDFDKVNPLAFYNITGFAMIGEDGEIELWPTLVEEIATTLPVKATVRNNIISKTEFVGSYDQEVTFYPYTTVTLAPTGSNTAVIYYYIDYNTETISDKDVKWTTYGQPFTVTRTCRVHAKAIREGYGESIHTHLDFTLAPTNSSVEFNIDMESGKSLVTLTTQIDGADIYWTTDNTVATSRWTKYTAPITFYSDTQIWAYAKKGDNNTTTPVSQLVKVFGGGVDSSKMSGRLNISHELKDDKYIITIAPENTSLATGTYDIHYTLDGSTPSVLSPKYTGPFEMPKTGGIVLAILKEASKQYPGEVAHLNISYIPTGIEGIDSDNESQIRVDGSNIIAPQGTEVYDITGRRVATTALRPGIYIVKIPGAKAAKISIK